MASVNTDRKPASPGHLTGHRDRSGFRRFARVALPVPLQRTFSYGVPDSLAGVQVGCRVWVRFGKRVLMGCVVELSPEPPELPAGSKLQPLLNILDHEPAVGANLLALGDWLADYYIAPPGEVIRSMLPPETPRSELIRYERTSTAAPAVLRKGQLAGQVLAVLERPMTARALARLAGRKQVTRALAYLADKGYVRTIAGRTESRPRIPAARISEEGRRALESETLRPGAARVLTLLATAEGAVPLRTIRNELGLKRGPFRGLAVRGYIRLEKQELRRSPWSRLGSEPETVGLLTEAQSRAVGRIEKAIEAREFFPLVLYGVTGSGKTEVYLKAVEMALKHGRSALLLVPEIGLTPRLAGLLRQRFGDRVAILHSALGAGERRDEWWRARQGKARVVVGARAAALAPLDGIGLVVVDEEHDSSYKQEESPRYNARDVAIKRAQHEQAVVVLGSATPSLNSYTHAVEGRYRISVLPERIARRPLPRVELIDMRETVQEEGPEAILSRRLREAVGARLEAGEQALILLNRRGYASHLICRQCGLPAHCSECSVSLTLHRKAVLAVCHYCGLGRPTPARCDVCRGEYLKYRGYGTERVEEMIQSLYPGIRVARMDRDTMRGKGSHEALLSRFGSGKLDLVVGTQMLAKGHDFPSVTLVGVLAADMGLGVPDFRASERTFQLLTQVAGRAGRGDRPGEVLIQTFAPEHYSLRHACAQDYPGFYNEEMRFRRMLGYPPVVSLINLIFEGSSMPEATRQARRVAAALRETQLQVVQVLGPAFAPRSKVAGRYRCQVLVKLPRAQHRAVREKLRSLMEDASLSRSIIIDVDPYTLH